MKFSIQCNRALFIFWKDLVLSFLLVLKEKGFHAHFVTVHLLDKSWFWFFKKSREHDDTGQLNAINLLVSVCSLFKLAVLGSSSWPNSKSGGMWFFLLILVVGFAFAFCFLCWHCLLYIRQINILAICSFTIVSYNWKFCMIANVWGGYQKTNSQLDSKTSLASQILPRRWTSSDNSCNECWTAAQHRLSQLKVIHGCA